MHATVNYKNILLRSLMPTDLAAVTQYLEPVSLPRLHYLERPYTEITHLYFPETGIASTVAVINETREIDVGLIGREGVTGSAVLLGAAQTPLACYMQMAGHGYRICSADMCRLLAERRSLLQSMLAYVNAFLVQQQATAYVNGLVKLQGRLARWLLMVHDRSEDDTFSVTHDFLAVMLGVRRPGITVGLHVLEGAGLIRSNRGRITVMNRKALVETSGGTYGTAEREYLRLIGKRISRE